MNSDDVRRLSGALRDVREPQLLVRWCAGSMFGMADRLTVMAVRLISSPGPQTSTTGPTS